MEDDFFKKVIELRKIDINSFLVEYNVCLVNLIMMENRIAKDSLNKLATKRSSIFDDTLFDLCQFRYYTAVGESSKAAPIGKKLVKEIIPNSTKFYGVTSIPMVESLILGNYYYSTGDDTHAIQEFSKFQSTAKETLLQPFYLLDVLMLSQSYTRIGDRENAKKLLLSAIAIHNPIKTPHLYLSLIFNLALVNRIERDYQVLIEILETNLSLLNSIQYETFKIKYKMVLVEAYFNAGMIKKAEPFLDTILISNDLVDPKWYGLQHSLIGKVKFFLGLITESIQFELINNELQQKFEDHFNLFNSYLSLALYYKTETSLNLAEENLYAALNVGEITRDPFSLAMVYLAAIGFYIDIKQIDEVNVFLNKLEILVAENPHPMINTYLEFAKALMSGIKNNQDFSVSLSKWEELFKSKYSSYEMKLISALKIINVICHIDGLDNSQIFDISTIEIYDYLTLSRGFTKVVLSEIIEQIIISQISLLNNDFGNFNLNVEYLKKLVSQNNTGFLTNIVNKIITKMESKVNYLSLKDTGLKTSKSENLDKLTEVQNILNDQKRITRHLMHDINNLLMINLNYAYLILNSHHISPQLKSDALAIIKSNEDVSGLISSYIDHDRFGLISFIPKTSKFDYSEMIEDKVSIYQSRILNKELLMEKKIAPGHFMDSNAELVSRMVDNLMSNAIKYADNHSTIKIEIEKRKNFLYLTLQNQCETIPANEKSKIMEVYYRYTTDGKGEPQGFGLGLSFCESTANLLNGRFVFESPIPNEVRGVRVTLILPITFES